MNRFQTLAAACGLAFSAAACAPSASAQTFPDEDAIRAFNEGVAKGLNEWPRYQADKQYYPRLRFYQECMASNFAPDVVEYFNKTFRFGLATLQAANQSMTTPEKFTIVVSSKSPAFADSALSILVQYGVPAAPGTDLLANSKSLTVDVIKKIENGKPQMSVLIFDHTKESLDSNGKILPYTSPRNIPLSQDGKGFAGFLGIWATLVAPEQARALQSVRQLSYGGISIHAKDCGPAPTRN